MTGIRIAVAWGMAEAGAGARGEVELHLSEPASLRQALDEAAHAVPSIGNFVATAAAFGVWGKVRAAEHVLRDGDRVEIYRALKADPKDARRANAGKRRSGKM